MEEEKKIRENVSCKLEMKEMKRLLMMENVK
jgi:hypothetical protein